MDYECDIMTYIALSFACMQSIARVSRWQWRFLVREELQTEIDKMLHDSICINHDDPT